MSIQNDALNAGLGAHEDGVREQQQHSEDIETLDIIEDQEYSNVFDERALPQPTVLGSAQTLSMADKLARCEERNRMLCERRRAATHSDSFQMKF